MQKFLTSKTESQLVIVVARNGIERELTVGYLLDEIKNDITRETSASFEPTIDYVVTKIPRFAFEKFPQTGVAAFGRKPPFKNLLSLRRSAETPLRMKSVGEAMAIGRTFKENLQKCLRSLEIGRSSVGAKSL